MEQENDLKTAPAAEPETGSETPFEARLEAAYSTEDPACPEAANEPGTLPENPAGEIAAAPPLSPELSRRVSQLEAAVNQQRQQAQQQENDRIIAGQLAELNRIFPECGIHTDRELFSTRNQELVLRAAQLPNGSLADAYLLLHREEILNRQAALGRQAAINAARSGEHLHGIKAAGGDAEDGMTEELYRVYSEFGYTRRAAAAAHKRLQHT